MRSDLRAASRRGRAGSRTATRSFTTLMSRAFRPSRTRSPNPMVDPNVPSLKASYIVALITTVVGLFATQGLIDNGTAKLVTGLAAALVPPAFALGLAGDHRERDASQV